jgi:hypothetical protein
VAATSNNVATIYFDQAGTFTIASSTAQPSIEKVGYVRLISRSRDIAFAKEELTVFLLCEVLPLAVWILVVCLLRALAYGVIRKLPRMVRRHAAHEVDAMLTFAKWAGVFCYVLWTGKDILAGVGRLICQ